MSGRALHLRDGKLITNRKTDARRSPNLAKHDMPDWRVTLPLPGALAFSVSSEYPTGTIGVAIKRDDIAGVRIEATGKDCQWLFSQIAKYLGTIKNGFQGRMHLRAQRDAYPGCTEGAPLRAAVDRSQDVYLVMEPSLVIPRGHRDPLILPVK